MNTIEQQNKFSTLVLRSAAVAGGDEWMKPPTAQMPNVACKFMRRFIIIIISFATLLTIVIAGCLFTKGHFTKDGSMWVWNKDPSGRYNEHNTLQIDKATNWVDTVLKVPALRTLKVEVTSKKWDHYDVNDSIMFFDLKSQELPNYHSYYTFANRLNCKPELLKRIVLDFDKLGLNRFYREDSFLAFTTVTSLGYARGYLYFIDPTVGIKMNTGDTLSFENGNEFKYFREGRYSKLLVTKKYNNHWIEWEVPQ
jgi:hypothetical protein